MTLCERCSRAHFTANVSTLMNRFTFLTDIAGRLARDVAGSPRVTAAAVAFGSGQLDAVARQLPRPLPKWKDCRLQDAEAVVSLLGEETIAVGIFSINKDTAAWHQFWEDARPLRAAIVAQDRRPAGFVKPANVLAFLLISGACAVATGHALRIGSKHRILDYRGRDLIERTVICDSDIDGDENLEVFRSLWERHDGSQPRLESMGIRIATREVRVTTEQQEPLLLLADYAAGISHAALLPDPGRIPLPLSVDDAKKLLGALNDRGKIAVQTCNFEFTYKEVFGHVMDLVGEQAAC